MSDYLRDPAEIQRRSFAAVREAADLSAVPSDLEPLVLRLVHACAAPEIVGDFASSGNAVQAGRKALESGAPILVDTRMTASGIIRDRLPADNAVLCTLHDERVAELAQSQSTTRSAAAVELWLAPLGGAVVAIGNAPTALFRLLELLRQGADRPALILGFPVGFVGAAEAKEALIEGADGIPYVTLRGRRGGSAMAAAAVNALAGDEQ